MTQEALNIAGQCRATASSTLAKNILVDGGSGLLTELLLDAARVIEALVQPEQEPVAWMDADGNTFPFVWNVGVQQGSKYLDETLIPLYTYPPQRTEQEPVAWLCKPDENGLFGLPTSDKGCKDCFPVYRKRTWVGLTVNEIALINADYPLPQGFAKAIEAKLKDKNCAG
jgi:hypothetical protein